MHIDHPNRAVIASSPLILPHDIQVSVALREYPELAIYAMSGDSLPWGQLATHSQGLVTGTRASFIESELERIRRYTEKGDLAVADQVWAYMEQRDSSDTMS